MSEKPPIGLKPRYVHDYERANQILDAMDRYSDALMTIPKSWVEELRDIIKCHISDDGRVKEV